MNRPARATSLVRLRTVLSLLAVLGILLGAAAALIRAESPGRVATAEGAPPVDPPGLTIEVSLGYSRQPMTRTLLVNVCTVDSEPAPPECGTPRRGDSEPTERPAVVLAAVDRDLRRTTGRGEFPANQLTVSAVNDGAKALRVTVTVDPQDPEDVPPGVYEGLLLIERDDGTTGELGITVSLDDRGDWAVTWKSLAMLTLGALLGAAVKFVSEWPDQQPDGNAAEPPRFRLSPSPAFVWKNLIAVVAVVFVGYQTQLLANVQFDGDRLDYVGLAAWALGLQVTGTTIADALGRARR